MGTKKARAVVVGGSIAGVSCAHALILAGWDVVVLEKSCAPPSGSPTGAGLSLDPQTCQLIESWLPHPDLLPQATLHLSIDQDQVTDSEKKISWTLTRDENFNFRAAHWADLHDLLYKPLAPDIFLWGHHFLSFHMSHDKAYVIVEAKNLKTGKIVEIVGDLLIAADGCMSEIRRSFLPDLQLRYTGYSAWRGVLDFSGDENSETIIGIRKAYPELGKCLYFDLAHGSHCVLYELRSKRLNWIWYLNQPEPELKEVSMEITTRGLSRVNRTRAWVVTGGHSTIPRHDGNDVKNPQKVRHRCYDAPTMVFPPLKKFCLRHDFLACLLRFLLDIGSLLDPYSLKI